MAQNHRPQIILNGSQCVVPGQPKNIQKTLVVPMVPFQVYLSVYLSICLSVYLSISLSIYPSIHPSIHRSIDLCKKKNESQVLQKEISGLSAPSRGTFPAASSSAAARRASIRIQCGRRFQIEKWDVVKSIINGIVLGLFTSINSML